MDLQRLPTTRRQLIWAFGLMAIAGCAPATPSPTAAPKPTAPPPQPTPVAKAESKPTVAPTPVAKPTQAPVAKTPIKVKLGQAFHSLSFATMYVARELYFKAEGIDLDFQITSGPLTDRGVMSGELDIGCGGTSNFLTLIGNDQAVLAVACATHEMTQGVIVTKQFAESKGLTRDQPIADRVRALKGTTMAVNSISGAPDRYFRWLLRKYGVNPEQDLQIIAISGNPAQVAALETNQVQGIFSAPPIGEQLEYENKAFFLIWMPKDEPRFKSFIYEVLEVRQDYAQKNQEALERVGRAVARANNYTNDNPAGAKTILAKYFDEVPKPVIDLVMDTSLKSAFGRDARMSVEQWRNAHDISLESGALPKAVDITEGKIWTNQYLKDIPKN